MYSYDGRVRFSEINEQGDMTLISIINYLQDAASFHGQEVGFGVDWSKETGIAWVVASLQVQVLRFPHFGERLKIQTWSIGFKSCIGYRQYAIRKEDGELLVMANSEWVLMNLPEAKMIRVPEEQIRIYGEETEYAYDVDFGKRKVRRPKDGRKMRDYLIGEEHLDTNHHVNNVQYIRMAEKILPADYQVKKIRVEFRKQARLGDLVEAFSSNVDGKYVVSLEDQDGKAYFVGEFSDVEMNDPEGKD